MASNNGTTTGFLTSWSSVVHEPEDEPEESELPSTVDIGFLHSGPSEQASNQVENEAHSESDSDSENDSSNSESGASGQSCSHSDSSDSENDSSSSSQDSSSRSRSPSPEFSVTQSQTNSLRLTIATVRKSVASPINTAKSGLNLVKSSSNQSKTSSKASNNSSKSSESAKITTKKKHTSSSDGSSSDSESESDPKPEKSDRSDKNDKNDMKSVSSAKKEDQASRKMSFSTKSKSQNSTPNKESNKDKDSKSSHGEKREGKNTETENKKTQRNSNSGVEKNRTSGGKTRTKRKTKKMASLPHSRSSTYTSSDSESSEDLLLQSTSLQEIRQEDLAAILPESECNDFNDFDGKNAKDSPATGDLSGSDMELPQQAIKSLIDRTTESSSDGETPHQLPNPQTLFANSLLQQFVAQTQIINNSCTNLGSNESLNVPNVSKDTNCDSSQSVKSEKTESIRSKRRGRPKRDTNKTLEVPKVSDFCANPNVSPDSGIQNSPDHVSSPEPNLSPTIRQRVVQNKENNNKRKSNNENKPAEREKLQNKPQKAVEKAKPAAKLPVTSNQFDRVLYANSDRVLYPPKRKAGRPPSKKGAARFQKPKNEVNTSKINIQTAKNTGIKTKGVKNGAGVKSLKSKQGCTLKVPKILHSKHKHKHKKRKFKILKPLSECDPKLNQEIEKLIVDFVKFCIITQKSPREVGADQILKTLKKVTKKRRTTDHLEKKKKKTNVNTTVSKVQNSNEQRLPLKKRHYHLVSNSSETGKADNEVLDDNSEDAMEEVKIVKKEKVKSPKHAVPVIKSHINNNEYDFKEENHVDQAIEACIYKFSKNPEKVNTEKVLTTNITPKKRHRLENNLNSSPEDDKKHILSIVKDEKDVSDTEKPKPKVSVESFINELKIKRNLVVSKGGTEDKVLKIEDDKATEVLKKDGDKLEVQKNVQVSPESTKKKVRKRRAPNRTGFPTVKKKKKKTPPVEASTEEKLVDEPPKAPSNACDRVPKEGEEYTKFLERSSTEKCLLQSESDIMARANEDLMSECESLPIEERTDYDLDDVSLACRYKNRLRDLNDSNSGSEMTSLETSIERLKSRLDEKKRKRAKDGKHLTVLETLPFPRKRRRDDSPASSILSIESRQSSRLKDLKEDRLSASGDEGVKCKNKKAPKWKKSYLVAGLFSDYYKGEEQKDPPKPSRNLTYNPGEHPYGLLPPPYHCGKYLRCRKVDFQLPFELWWQHTHSQLPGRDVVPSWNYKKIRTNVYNVKNNGGACEPQGCNCKSTSNCGDDCLNRLVFAECPAESHRCRNQRIQKHHWAPGIEKFMTEDKGWGVRTKEPIKQGEFILEYVGEVVSDQEFKERMNSIYLNDNHHYCLHLDGGLVIDGHRMGSDGRFVNHSCQPNCEMQKWSVNGQFRMALFASRDIKSDEELTYDYNFSLFNLAEGQECKCASDNCRGVIGGKTQRTRQLPETTAPPKPPGRVGRPRKTEATKKKLQTTSTPISTSKEPKILISTNGNSNSSTGGTNGASNSSSSAVQNQVAFFPQIQVKPMSHQQKIFILEHHCFLLRNLTKVRKVRDRSQSVTSTNSNSRQQSADSSNTKQSTSDSRAFMNQLNALQKPRNMKTRRIAQVDVDPELNKTVKLAAILKEILTAVIDAKDEKGESLSSNFMTLPSKRKCPEFYQKVTDPLDLSTIEQNIATGVYKNARDFDSDMSKLFHGYLKFYARTDDIGICATKLKTLYLETKKQISIKFKDVLGEKPPPAFAISKKNVEEDIIRCICGIPNDEGLMIQCERCLVWQHNECVKADVSAVSYHCEICVPRNVDYEIPMDEFTEHGHRYYMTLMRGDLQLRQGDTVYVLRDIPIPGTDKKHTYESIGKIDHSELDIFRIERLWKDKDTGKRFAYGHHYLRPHETYHEPTRKFFPNEVMRVPLYEAVPVELVMQRCWVMDVNTYCKGRPVGADEEHIYICELRVDKGARMFSKASKSAFPICTKSFAFDRFEERLKITRTYCPHEVDEALFKGKKYPSTLEPPPTKSSAAEKPPHKDKDNTNKSINQNKKDKDNNSKIKDTAKSSQKEKSSSSALEKNRTGGEKDGVCPQSRDSSVATPVIVKTRVQQKTRLNKILLNLLSKMPTKQAVDVSYLLEGGRRRKKQDQVTGNTSKSS